VVDSDFVVDLGRPGVDLIHRQGRINHHNVAEAADARVVVRAQKLAAHNIAFC
jgi:hypothetical protein